MSNQVRLSLVAVTILYLLFELSYSARLLDVLGSQYNQDIRGLELYGRIFSGVAFSLLFFGRIFSNHSSFFLVKLLKMSVIVLLSIIGMWFLQEWIIDSIKSRYTVEEKSKMTYLSLSSGMIATGELPIEGLTQADIASAPHAFQSFVALYPYLYQHNHRQTNLPDNIKDKILTFQVTSSCDLDEGTSCLGDADTFHTKIWMPARQSILDKIEGDIAAYQQKQSKEAVGMEAKNAWEKYKEEASKATGRPFREIKKHWIYKRNVSDHVVKSLSPYLAKGWDIEDEAAFKRAYARKHMDNLHSESQKLFKARLPNNLTARWVFEQPETQWEINAKFGLVRSRTIDPMNMIVSESDKKQQEQYDKANLIKFDYHATTKQQSLRMHRQLVEFHKKRTAPMTYDGSHENQRYSHHAEAYFNQYLDRVIIPFIALLFSLAGGLLHIIKLVVVLLGYVTRSLSVKLVTTVAMLLISLTVPLNTNNGITRSAAFGSALSEHDAIRGSAIRWLVNAQELIYPLNHFIRKFIMRDIEYKAISHKR